MFSYTLKKIIMTIPTLFILALLIFMLMRSVPGDPAVLIVGDLADPAVLAQVRLELGLDKPAYVQFWLWLSRALGGDLGVSLITGEDILTGLLSRFTVTAQVVLVAILFSASIAIPAGMVAAWRQNRPTDFSIVFLMNVFLSIPGFWMALMFIFLFGVYLNWLPTIGYVSLAEDFSGGMKYLLMPVLSLVFLEVATLTRMMRASSIEVLRQEYVTHARAKGLSEGVVLRRHVFKNAFAPTLTMLGLTLGSLLGGAAVIETVFTLPGLGRFLVEAIYARDYAVVQGVLIFVAGVYVLVNLCVDLLYPVLDPRVRL
ncbi:ABC transporter permease [Kordiimonas pumila]|uniref:ABC transporter permease n=1 Tax=Kordiimonas pumila TaxID=2161677 RepID=A0ABV7D3W2_9PROT|nr:ABC transporter permease [Kordiimonas pumila]